MSFNRLFEKLPKKSIKWLILILEEHECSSSTRMNSGSLIVFDIHKQLYGLQPNL